MEPTEPQQQIDVVTDKSPELANVEVLSLSEDVEQAFTTALEEARQLGHNYLGTEHLLYGLVASSTGSLAEVFASLGITPDAIDAQIKDIIGTGAVRYQGSQVDASQRVRGAMQGAYEFALADGARFIDSTYITLALCREIGVAGQVLLKLDVSPIVLGEDILIKAGLSEEQVDEWSEAAEAYGDMKVFETLTALADLLTEANLKRKISLRLSDSIKWD